MIVKTVNNRKMLITLLKVFYANTKQKYYLQRWIQFSWDTLHITKIQYGKNCKSQYKFPLFSTSLAHFY